MEKSKSKSQGYLSLFAIVAATFFITFPAGFVTRAALDPWYYNLVKPAFNPPNWIFGPVWTLLYVMMSVAVWLALLTTCNSASLHTVCIIWRTMRFDSRLTHDACEIEEPDFTAVWSRPVLQLMRQHRAQQWHVFS